jgi:hypothetical protein
MNDRRVGANAQFDMGAPDSGLRSVRRFAASGSETAGGANCKQGRRARFVAAGASLLYECEG